MEHTAPPAFNDPPPTSSSDPRQPRPPTNDPSTKNITAETIPTSGSVNTHGNTSAGTEYNAHMKGTAAPGSQSELFGLKPGEKQVHPPAGSGPSSGVIGTSGHKGTHNTSTSTMDPSGTTGAVGSGTGDGQVGEGEKPSMLDKLNPMKDADQNGKKGIGD